MKRLRLRRDKTGIYFRKGCERDEYKFGRDEGFFESISKARRESKNGKY